MECKVITYRYSKSLHRSIPEKTIVSDNPVFSFEEIKAIFKAVLMINPPAQVKKVK